MAEYSEKILLSVNIENTDAVKRLAEIKTKLDELKTSKKNATSPEEFVKYGLQIKQLSDEQRKLTKTLNDTATAQKANTGSINQQRAILSTLTAQWNDLTQAERENVKIGVPLQAEIKAVSDNLKTLEKSVGDNRRNVGNYGETVAGLELRLRELNETIKHLPLGSDQLKAAQNDAAGLRNEIDLALGKVDEFGNREPKNAVKKSYEDAADAAAGLTSGITLLNVAFGDSENLQELQAKSLQAMAIAQNVANVMKSKGAIIDTAALIKQKALTVAQAYYTTVVGQSTGALRIFKTALATTGIGAVVVLLGEMIFNFDEVNKRVNQFINFQKNLVREVTGGNEVLATLGEILVTIGNPIIYVTKGISALKDAFGPEFKADVEALTKTYERFEANLERSLQPINEQIALRKAQGATEAEMADLTRTKLQQEVDARRVAYDRAKQLQAEFIKSGQVFNDEQEKLFNQVTDAFGKAELDRQIFEAEQETKRREEAKKRAKERADQRKAEIAALVELEKSLYAQVQDADIEAIENETVRQAKRLELEAQREKDAINGQLAALKGSEEEKARAKELSARRIVQIDQKLTDDLEALEKARGTAILQEQYAADMAAIQQQLELDELRAENEISDEKELAERKLLIRSEALAAQLKLTKQFAEADGMISEEEQRNLDLMIEKITALNQRLKEARDNDGKNLLGLTKEETEGIQATLDVVAKGLGTLQQAFTQTYDERIEKIEAEKNAQIKAVEDSTLSEEEKDKKVQAIEKASALRKWEQEVKAFNVAKGIQISNAVIQTAQAVLAAFSSGVAYPFIGPATGAVFAAAAGVLGATQIGIIAAQKPPAKPSFFDGGFTEPAGSPYEESRYSNEHRTLHKKEYVAPWKVIKRPEAIPHIAALEAMRVGTPGWMNLQGYANGGYTDGGYAATRATQGAMPTLSAEDVANATANAVSKVKVITMISDINKVGGEVVRNQVRYAV